jgi:cell division septation protein DedD
MAELQKAYGDVSITELKTAENTYHRVRVGRFRTREEAYHIASRLAQEGYTVFMARIE